MRSSQTCSTADGHIQSWSKEATICSDLVKTENTSGRDSVSLEDLWA